MPLMGWALNIGEGTFKCFATTKCKAMCFDLLHKIKVIAQKTVFLFN